MASTDRGQSLRTLYTSQEMAASSQPTSPPASTSSLAMRSTAKKPGQAMADAAATAEFNEKRWVWLPDEKKGYLAGWIIRDVTPQDTNKEDSKTDDATVDVRCVDDKTRTIRVDLLEKMNPPKFDKVEDNGELTFLNEPSVVHNLRQRYESKMIYTYSGLFLVAINPYHPLPIYTPQVIAQYKNRRREENPPHVFAIAERAWQHMLGERENQSILITGESGAGKTENTKRVISYLTAIASTHKFPTSGSESSVTDSSVTRPSLRSRMSTSAKVEVSDLVGKRLGKLERQILQANPILESFGNAQTVRNNNSSRFGKFVRIEFNSLGAIAGANIDWYLLEKSRVTSRSEKERSFHIFYQLLIGCSPLSEGGDGEEKLAERLLLDSTDPKDYGYLSRSKLTVDGMYDLEEWRNLRDSLNVVGLDDDEQFNLFKIISIILHIGNIVVQSDRSDVAYIQTSKEVDSYISLEKTFHLLGLPNLEEFKKSLLKPKIKAGREFVTQQRNAKQVKEELSSLCTTLYEKTFGKLVEKINTTLDRNQKRPQNSLASFPSTFIGVLDIAGFEIFETNGFEQLCINYTNERLQQFFNHHMFVLEQEEYSREDIDWDFVNFGLDLQPTIDLIESSSDPIGILSCLDEECIMPKATDTTFTEKLIGLVAQNPNPKFIKSRFNTNSGFIIQHYAGQVEYLTQGWLEKNKDPLNSNLTNVLASSNDKFIANLFEEYRDPSLDPNNGTSNGSSTNETISPPIGGTGKRRAVKRGAFRTVGQRHKEQLTSLMSQLQSTQPHFVRCIVPNADKRPGLIDVKLVLDQLRCNGVLEGIRIARLGYPNRLPFIEFRQRYEVLTPGIIPSGYMDGRKACIRMLEALELDDSVYKIGLTKAFFKSGVLAELEERRDEHLYEVFTNLQANCRSFILQRKMKKILNKAMSVRVIQRNARIYNDLKSWPWWQLYTRVRPLLAATRDDNELRKKMNELNQLKEKNEKERLEKERIEGLKNAIEIEKQRVESQLEQERLLSLSKEEQLVRSKEMEIALVEELETTRKELEALEDSLEGELRLHELTKSRLAEMNKQMGDLNVKIQGFEAELSASVENEQSLKLKISDQQRLIQQLETEKADLNKTFEDLKRQQSESEEDLQRSERRMKAMIADLEGKLEFEIQTENQLRIKTQA
ncbi:myosin type-2 heavy chain 2 [Phakopsora pachyrhizi]|nr:myosin type-2 heavy chain 2 [Phakopsora pachyrhizi]